MKAKPQMIHENDPLGSDTFTIVARCPRTARLGIGMATRAQAVGNRCPTVKPGFGAASVQCIADPRLTLLAGRLMAFGYSAKKVVADLVESDPDHGLRQIAVVDSYGRAEAFTGAQNAAYAGHIVGDQFACIANGVVSARVVEAMAEAMTASADKDLEERLMLSVEAAGKAGGQAAGHNSSCLL